MRGISLRGAAYLLAAALLPAFLTTFAHAEPEPKTVVRHVQQARYLTARDQLHQLLFSEADLVWKRRALYMLGHVNLKLGAYQEAASYFEEARKSLPALSDYALYNLGIALAGSGRYSDARRALSELIDGEPTTRLKPHAHLKRAEAAFADGDWKAARSDYGRVVEVWPDFSERPQAYLRLGQIFEAMGEDEKALSSYKRSVFSGPSHPAAAEASKRLEALRSRSGLRTPTWSAEETVALGRALLKAGRPEEALDMLDTLRGRRVSADLGGQAELEASKAQLALGRRSDAVKRLQRLVGRHPRHPDVPEALYLEGRSLWNLDKIAEARVVLRELLHLHRSSPFCEQAFYILGRIYEEQGRFERSAKAFRELAAAYPASELAREGLWRMGWNAYRRGRAAEAVTKFQQALGELASSDWEDEVTYWLARSYEKAGQDGRALGLYRELAGRYPHTYYGQRAAFRLERKGGDPPESASALKPARDETAPYDPAWLDSHLGEGELRRLERARELAAMGFSADARGELDLAEADLKSHQGAERTWALTLGALYNQSGLYEMSIRTLNGPFASMAPEEVVRLDRRFWELYYPRPHLKLIEREALARGLEPALVLGLIRQESAFDAQAVSPAGAVGLMQLMPSRAEAEEGQLNDPEVNLARGTAHLVRLLKEYDGRVVDALVAYNAGARRLESWKKRFGSLEEDEFIEAIPFSETRTYVKRVLRNAFLYRTLYSSVEAAAR